MIPPFSPFTKNNKPNNPGRAKKRPNDNQLKLNKIKTKTYPILLILSTALSKTITATLPKQELFETRI